MSRAAASRAFTTPCALHVSAKEAAVLTQITDPAVDLALWQRPPQQAIVQELSCPRTPPLADLRRTTSRATFDADVRALMQQQGADPGTFEHLRGDMAQLAALFFNISHGREVCFRLWTTSTDGGRRFHFDRKHLRLLCTYKGPGTEWLADAQVKRVAQARCAPNSAVMRYGEPAQFQTFWVGILQGDPANQGTGLVHRSPPIEDARQTRVLFCLDC